MRHIFIFFASQIKASRRVELRSSYKFARDNPARDNTDFAVIGVLENLGGLTHCVISGKLNWRCKMQTERNLGSVRVY